MTIACPACRAENGERTCRRCKADLGMLFDLEAQRAQLLAAAADNLPTDPSHAIVAARSARELREGPDAQRLEACARLLSRDFAAALSLWSSQRRSGFPA